METPSSTRSQTSSAASNNIPTSSKKEEGEKSLSIPKQGKSHPSVLIDITNDSPIIGLAAGRLETPSSLARNRGGAKQTPGSGEALLRGQVKALLQKVEEEGEFLPLSFNQRPVLSFQALLNSPTRLLAPTPTNTPLLSNLLGGGDNDIKGLVSVIPVDEVLKEDSEMTQGSIDSLKPEKVYSCEDLVTRALLFDSPGKSETSDSSSVLTQERGSSVEDSLEGDNSSIWSVQANASSRKEEEEEEEEIKTIDGLCEGLRNICVEDKIGIPEFKGRHTRFIYNEKDEIEGEEEVEGTSAVVCSVSPSILCLKGMPVPEGKHLRFPEEDEED